MKYLFLLLFPLYSLAQPGNPSGDPDDTLTVVVSVDTLITTTQIDTLTIAAPSDTLVAPQPEPVLSPAIRNLKRQKGVQHSKDIQSLKFYRRNFFNTKGWHIFSSAVILVTITTVKAKDGTD